MRNKALLSIFFIAIIISITTTACYKDKEQNKPTVKTTDVTNITDKSAVSGGSITNDQGEKIVARGVCWSTSPNPTIKNSKTNDGTSMFEFTSNITGLSPNTKYYVRAYATLRQLDDESGTGYGKEISFTTLP